MPRDTLKSSAEPEKKRIGEKMYLKDIKRLHRYGPAQRRDYVYGREKQDTGIRTGVFGTE